MRASSVDTHQCEPRAQARSAPLASCESARSRIENCCYTRETSRPLWPTCTRSCIQDYVIPRVDIEKTQLGSDGMVIYLGKANYRVGTKILIGCTQDEHHHGRAGECGDKRECGDCGKH